jgi:hypothetical protein
VPTSVLVDETGAEVPVAFGCVKEVGAAPPPAMTLFRSKFDLVSSISRPLQVNPEPRT